MMTCLDIIFHHLHLFNKLIKQQVWCTWHKFSHEKINGGRNNEDKQGNFMVVNRWLCKAIYMYIHSLFAEGSVINIEEKHWQRIWYISSWERGCRWSKCKIWIFLLGNKKFIKTITHKLWRPWVRFILPPLVQLVFLQINIIVLNRGFIEYRLICSLKMKNSGKSTL